MDKLMAPQSTVEVNWKQGLRHNQYEPSYVSNLNKMFDKQTKTDRGDTMNSTENLIKIENYNLNETFLGGLYNKLVENSPNKVPKEPT